VHGVLVADNRFTAELPDEVARLVFGLLADHAGSAIEAAHEYERVAAEARTDALTQLRHHGSLMDDLAGAVRETTTSGEALGLAMIDLDDFKSVNDTLGHLAGDALLAGVAARMRDVVRAGETPYRYGGEEFAVVLPGADTTAAARVGERIRRAVGDQAFPIGEGDGLRVTCSVGVASLPAHATDAQALVASADAALLAAKAAGKDQVVSA